MIPRLLRTPPVLVAGLAVLGCCSCAVSPKDTPPALPAALNVVLVSIDTLRADHLGLYGYPRDTSPHLERLAGEGVVFTQMVNNGGGTLPVHMSMMTSLAPRVHNVLPNNDRALDPGRITLSEQLRDSGFTTAAFVDGGYLVARYGFDQGFDLYDDSGGGFNEILPRAMDWLDLNSTSPFFLFLHTYDVHSKSDRHPYDCPGYNHRYFPDYQGDFDGCVDDRCATMFFLWLNKKVKKGEPLEVADYLAEDDLAMVEARYDGCINYVDDQLRVLFDRLRGLGLWEETLVIVTSDHGEEFLEHGLLLHQNPAFDTNMRVPLVVKFPGAHHAGARIDHLASTIDIMPTVLAVLGIEANDQIMGVSLLPAIQDDEPVRPWVNARHYALRTASTKLILHGDEVSLFDLEADPAEQTDVSDAQRAEVETMSRALRQSARRDRELFDTFIAGQEQAEGSPNLTPDEVERLRALGYLD